MMRGRWTTLVIGLALCTFVLGQTRRERATEVAGPLEWSESELQKIYQHSPLPSPPADPTNRVADDSAAAHFGQYLFFDPRLSGDHNVSCATCHDPQKGFSNGNRFGQGTGTTERHVQSLFNVAYNRWYYWSGAVDTLWSQAIKPIEGHDEMRNSRLTVAHLIANDEQLRAAYESIFGKMPDISDPNRFPPAGKPPSTKSEDIKDPLLVAWNSMTKDDQETINTIFVNLGKALAAYERKIVSRDSPFDRFVEDLRNNNKQLKENLSISAQRGLRLFIGKANCRLCHVGPNFTDGEFHSLGLPNHDGTIPSDPGRYAGAAALKEDPFLASSSYSDAPDGETARLVQQALVSPEHWGQFKVPSLRSVATSAPFMHQGHFDSLFDVIHYYSTLDKMVQMGHHRETILVPLNLTTEEQADLVAFLESLTGKSLDPALLSQPESPMPPNVQP